MRLPTKFIGERWYRQTLDGDRAVLADYRVVLNRFWLERLIRMLLVVIAFLLGCYEMGDSDIWWHLRGGQWILENGRVPRLDPFTFGSADRLWIDVHWSYEVILALVYRLGGVAAIVLLGAVVGACAFATVLTARCRDWPIAATVLCWIPALILFAFRLDPRPEIFSLFYLACYLIVLWHADERPRRLWLLPLVQVLWVNVQGLFILGPIILMLYITARSTNALWQHWQRNTTKPQFDKRQWKRLGAVVVAVALACLVNPYFLQGVWFPFDLFPKINDPHNLYKKYIDELHSPADLVQGDTLRVLGKNWFFLAFYFLLSLLPLSFLYPAAWRAAGAATGRGWFLALTAILALLLWNTLSLAGFGPFWLTALGDNAAPLCLLFGVSAAWSVRKYSPAAAFVVGVAGAFQAASLFWFDRKILGTGRGILASGASAHTAEILFALSGIVAAALILRWGGDLFRLLLTSAFGFLALQALQNWTRFALVAGTVLTWNFGEWVYAVQAATRQRSLPDRRLHPAALAAASVFNLLLAVVLLGWIVLLARDRFYIYTGLPRHFAFREEPLAFAHDAARFAGSPGLPDRALVYGLDQTGVYDFHNAPRYKPFMDGRLEMPAQSTFETYVAIEDWLEAQDPRWEKAVVRLGDPLVLLGHQGSSRAAAEAVLLTHPQWCCIYFDALAAVFVPRQRVSETNFPSVNFAARHFYESTQPCVPHVARAAAHELKALYNLSASLPPTSKDVGPLRLGLLLHALDRGQFALVENATQADVWVLLGNCYRDLNPHANSYFPAPVEDWQSERDLAWAQATYCFRHAVELQPDNAAAWRYLAMSYGRRRMVESELEASVQWLQWDNKIQRKQRDQIEALRRSFVLRQPIENTAQSLSESLAHLVRAGRPQTAVQRLEASGRTSWTWPFAERAAALYMELGRPADARRIWEQAVNCPSPALKDCRLAAAFWIERNFDAALQHYRSAQEKEPKLAEIWWGLAKLYCELGDARNALEACRRGLALPLTSKQRAEVEALQALVLPLVDRP